MKTRDYLDTPEAFDSMPIEKQTLLLEWIAKSLRWRKTFNPDQTSYSLKHVFERDRNKDTGEWDGYVTNGEFKGAMIQDGRFEVKDRSQLNWIFNAGIVPARK
jgi:hypothetical protein